MCKHVHMIWFDGSGSNSDWHIIFLRNFTSARAQNPIHILLTSHDQSNKLVKPVHVFFSLFSKICWNFTLSITLSRTILHAFLKCKSVEQVKVLYNVEPTRSIAVLLSDYSCFQRELSMILIAISGNPKYCVVALSSSCSESPFANSQLI
jgi:hypothetical protein